MKLCYGTLDLTTLGTLRVLGRTTRREPAEAPNRERVEYRVRLDFFESSFAANFAPLQTLLDALTTNQATLTWTDTGGQTYLDRPVTAGEDTVPRDVLEKGGTSWQAIEFSFWYYNHAVTSATLSGTFTPVTGAAQDLGAVEGWAEKLNAERFTPLRDARKLVTGTVTASGHWLGDTTLAVAQRQAALQAKAAALRSAILSAAKGTLRFGTFNQTVRVAAFNADVNQAQNAVAWTANFTYTLYPDETDYALLEYTLVTRRATADGVTQLTLAGKLQSTSEASARARLAALQTSLIPANYALVATSATPRTVGSETTGGGDGLTFVELDFSVEYRDTAGVATSLTVVGGATLDLGTVDKFREGCQVTRFDELRDPRKRSAGTVTLTGKWYVPESLSAADKTAALVAQLRQFETALDAADRATLVYGALFHRVVRVTSFEADADKLTNQITWTLTASWTRYPNEADYALVEMKIQRRHNRAEGIQHLTLTGTVKAPSEAAATARLTGMAAALVPADYVLLDSDITPGQATSETTGGAGDGTAFLEITFTLVYRDTAGITCIYRRSGANTPAVDLGTVDKFAVRTTSTLFDELRSVRKRAAGTVTLAGKRYAPETLSAAAKQALLIEWQAQMLAELAKGAAGSLVYGSVFNQTVRVLDFTAEINKLTNVVEWNVTGSYTAYPNEADYAAASLTVGTRANAADGTLFKTLAGTIGAQSPEAAYSKLARLRTTLIPAGYILQSAGTEEKRVSAESGLGTTGQNQGDGDAFIELVVNDVWQAAAGGHVLEWSLRTATDNDVKSPTTRLVYSGTVRAAAATQPAAFAAAQAQAAALGGGKAPFLLRSAVTVLDKLFQTAGLIFVTVEFNYDYEAQNTTTFLEVTSVRATDHYGQTTETVSGHIAAPSLAAAATCYQNHVRNLAGFAGALILAERTPTLNQQRIIGVAGAVLDQRYEFTLQLFRAKEVGQNSIRYDVQVTPDFRSLELSTTVQGTVWGATQVAAEAFLQTVLAGLSLPGKVVSNPRTPHHRQGPQTGGSGTLGVFESMDFSVTTISLFTGVAGILESECSEELVYSGARNVEKPIPDGPSIIQQCGLTCGQHTVTARCRATTQTAALAWVKGIRAALLYAANGSAVQAYEDPPRLGTRYGFLPQVPGVPAGANANVTLYEVNGAFAERIPELVFVA